MFLVKKIIIISHRGAVSFLVEILKIQFTYQILMSVKVLVVHLLIMSFMSIIKTLKIYLGSTKQHHRGSQKYTEKHYIRILLDVYLLMGVSKLK